MTPHLVHTCMRVRDLEASVRFYSALGFERRGQLNFDTAYNIYLGLPGSGDQLELTVNVGREEAYDLGEGYNHLALTVEDLDATLAALERNLGVTPEKPAYRPGGRADLPRIAFVADPDGYRFELIDGGTFLTPQDGPHPSGTSRPQAADAASKSSGSSLPQTVATGQPPTGQAGRSRSGL